MMISEALQMKLQRLTWDQRRAIHYLGTAANDQDYIYHPDGRSVATMVAMALDCHVSTAYELVTALEEMHLLITKPHPLAYRKRRSHGYCIYFVVGKFILSDSVAQAILRYPPRAHLWLGYDPIETARESSLNQVA